MKVPIREQKLTLKKLTKLFNKAKEFEQNSEVIYTTPTVYDAIAKAYAKLLTRENRKLRKENKELKAKLTNEKI